MIIVLVFIAVILFAFVGAQGRHSSPVDWNNEDIYFQAQAPSWREIPSGYAERSFDAIRSDRLGTFIIAGQSNAAGFGSGSHFTPTNADKVSSLSIFTGKVYEGREPGPNMNGAGTSWAYRLADRLIDEDFYDHVLIVPLAMGSAAASYYADGGPLANVLPSACEMLQQHGLEPTAVLWLQGERESQLQVPGEVYKATLQAVINGARQRGCNAPWLIAQASYVADQVNGDIRQAQVSLANGVDVFPGPDMDVMAGPDWRADGTHLSEMGMNHAAELWAQSITAFLSAR